MPKPEKDRFCRGVRCEPSPEAVVFFDVLHAFHCRAGATPNDRRVNLVGEMSPFWTEGIPSTLLLGLRKHVWGAEIPDSAGAR